MTMPTIRTRRESYEATLASLGPKQFEVARIVQLHDFPRMGITAWELAEEIGAMVHAVRPRLTELQALGLVEARGKRLSDKTGRNEAVWFLQKEQPKFDGDQGVLL